jgi:hypothetical protein
MNRIRRIFLIPSLLISINVSSQSLYPCNCEEVDNNKKFGYCDSATAKNKLECKFDSAFRFVKGLARVFVNGKYGFINTQGKLVIPAEYDKANDFSEGFAAVKKDNQYFFIDQTNKNPFGRNYYFANPKTLAALTKQQLKQFGDPLSTFSNGLAVAFDTSGYAGYINTKGIFVIAPKYLVAIAFGDGIAIVYENAKLPVKAIDKTGNTLFDLPEGWYPIESFSNGVAMVMKRVNRKGEYNVINTKGKLLFTESYDELKRFKNSFFQITKGLHSGIGNPLGQVIINPDTSTLFGIAGDIDRGGNYHAYLYDSKTFNKLGKMILLNKDFKRITPVGYSHIMDYENGFYEPYQKQADGNLLFGLLSKDGKELLPCEYDMIRYNSVDKLIFVKNKNDKEGLYDYTLKPILKEEYNSIEGWEAGDKSKLLEISKDGKQGLATKTGKIITSSEYTSISFMDYGANSYYEISKDKKKGILDLTGKEIIPPQYNSIFPEFEGGCPFLSVEKDGKFGWIDKTGKVLLPLIYIEPVSCPGKVIAAPAKIAEEEYVYINKSGKPVFGKKFQWASYFNDGIAYVKEKGKYGFINSTGAFIIPPSFDNISPISDGAGDYKIVLYQVTQGDKCGFYTAAGKPVGSLQYDTLFEEGYPVSYILSQGLIAVRQNGKWGYINTSGKMVIPAIYEYAYPYSEDKAEVGVDGKSFVIDKNGKVQTEAIAEKKAESSSTVKVDPPQAASFLSGDITPEFAKDVNYIFITTDSKSNLYTIKNRNYKTYTAHKYNGTSWSDISISSSGWIGVYDFKADDAGNLYMYAKPNNDEIHLYKYVSGKWDTIPAVILNGSIRFVYVNKKNELYVRGKFKNEQGPFYLAKYLENKWVPVGQALNNKFLEKAFADYSGNDIAEDEAGNLYVDIFRYSKPESKSYIAIWNGNAWLLMDTAKYKMDATIPNLAVTKKGTVYFPGFFKNETGDYSLVKGNAKTGWEMISTKAPGFEPGYFESVSLADNDEIYAAGWMRKNYEYIVAKWTEVRGWESFASGNSYIASIATTAKCIYATVKSGGRIFCYTEGSVVKEGEPPR